MFQREPSPLGLPLHSGDMRVKTRGAVPFIVLEKGDGSGAVELVPG